MRVFVHCGSLDWRSAERCVAYRLFR
jgi:hypothetical protein